MINFFRKTRKKLADDNKPIKYMRYAFGEILLVIIGILFSFQNRISFVGRFRIKHIPVGDIALGRPARKPQSGGPARQTENLVKTKLLPAS